MESLSPGLTSQRSDQDSEVQSDTDDGKSLEPFRSLDPEALKEEGPVLRRNPPRARRPPGHKNGNSKGCKEKHGGSGGIVKSPTVFQQRPTDAYRRPTDGGREPKIENAGTFVAKLRANTREMKDTVYVVHHLEQPLLGFGACEDLQLVRRNDLVINGTTDVNPEREFPKLFDGLGLLEQPYHIKLKEGAKPFSIPVPRREPLPLMPKLKEQLDAMVAQEVIKPVDEPTEWCAPIVLAGKPNGKTRICVDLSRLNLSVERELHPLLVL
ncbi:K02A2.6-like [Cordylochernes scorpioides]|uniref:K02A2.6-like n=1 Tax=Cordylochernes scorpioides TaxID=51811 RepID=A0ABY6L4M9_9ARAC|nr:K02A2.6-like [Cordylochernes scorpioides]